MISKLPSIYKALTYKTSIKLVCIYSFVLILSAVSTVTKAQSDNGAKLWANNCARCHNMRDPAEFRDDQWRVIVTHMRIRAGLSGGEAREILQFLQSSNNVSTNTTKSLVVSSNENSVEIKKLNSSNLALTGKEIYNNTCIACHGPDGKGAIPGVPNLNGSDSALEKSDQQLIQNITNGIQTPGATMPMPAKGGNPNLTASDIEAVVQYLRKEFGK